ncbi:phospholipase A2 inhibitor NAI-like [Pseudophryne corroboree]|uniref:phospholipase A2 inhibitor NAI-like n=1 Tax=Pseudophryne corroboree TaxID=495146 RepID=UPI0030815E67
MELKSLLLFLCILSALLEAGYALSCNMCINMNDPYCQGSSMDCPADNVCASSYTVTYIYESAVSKVFSRACAPKSQCNISGSASVPNGKIKIRINCCETDNCIPPTPTLPEDNVQRNGLTCETCGSDSSNYCDSDETMQCTGNERRCLLQTTEQSDPRNCSN